MATNSGYRNKTGEFYKQVVESDDIVRGRYEIGLGLRGLTNVLYSKKECLNAELAKSRPDKKLVELLRAEIANLTQTLTKAAHYHNFDMFAQHAR